jgi:hypothetical protein
MKGIPAHVRDSFPRLTREEIDRRVAQLDRFIAACWQAIAEGAAAQKSGVVYAEVHHLRAYEWEREELLGRRDQ